MRIATPKRLPIRDYMHHLAERLPERTVTMLEAGCCGMAGAFGMLESKYELSVKVAEPLFKRSGTSRSGPSWWPRAPVAASKSSIWHPSGCSTWPRCWPNRWPEL